MLIRETARNSECGGVPGKRTIQVALTAPMMVPAAAEVPVYDRTRELADGSAMSDCRKNKAHYCTTLSAK